MTKITLEIEPEELSARLFNLTIAGSFINELGLDEEKVVEYIEALTDDVVESIFADNALELPSELPESAPKPIGYTIRNVNQNYLPTAQIYPSQHTATDYFDGLNEETKSGYEVVEIHGVAK